MAGSTMFNTPAGKLTKGKSTSHTPPEAATPAGRGTCFSISRSAASCFSACVIERRIERKTNRTIISTAKPRTRMRIMPTQRQYSIPINSEFIHGDIFSATHASIEGGVGVAEHGRNRNSDSCTMGRIVRQNMLDMETTPSYCLN